MKKNYLNFTAYFINFILVSIFSFALQAQTISPPFFLDTKVPQVTLNSPNSGNYALGQTISVTWTATDDNISVNGVCIGLWDNDLEHFFVLEDNLSNDGSEQIELIIPSNNAKIKVVVRDEFGNPGSDMSDQNISVSGGYVLNGYVLEEGTNNPINNATVYASYQRFEFSDQTNSSGYYEIENLPPGEYAITAVKEGYESETSYKTITDDLFLNIHLTPGGSSANQIEINNKLTIYADNIQQTTSNKYQLSGNVNINGILYFDGAITLDKRSHLIYPEVSGNCPYSVHEIQRDNHTIKSGNDLFHFYCQDEKLTAKGYSVMNHLTTLVGGFTVKSGILEVDDDGEYVEALFIAQMPYPVDKIINYLEDKYNEDIPTLFDELGGSIIYHKTSGIGISANVSGIDCKFGLFDIENFHLNFNTTEQIYGGGLKLKIPGSIPGTDSNSDSTHQKQIPVKAISKEGDTTHYPNIEEFVMMQRAFGLEFLSLGFDIEFVQGGLNSLILYLGTRIPIDATGLFITEISGGVTDLQTEDWKIHAAIDITLGLELPVVGEPLKIDDLGVAIQPLRYFKGSGSLEVFGWETAGGYIEYAHSKRSLSLETYINVFNILQGKTFFNLRGKDFTGGGTCAVTTPVIDRRFFKRYSNLKLGSVELLFSNYDIRSQLSIGKLNLAQKIVFGKENFPWFHYYIGFNYDILFKIWKGNSLDGRDMIDFIVPENAMLLMVVSEGDNGLIDYHLQDPLGNVYDSTNSSYGYFPEVNETEMIVDQPMEGIWTFITSDTMQYLMEAMCNNQPPSFIVDNPASQRSRSNQITIAFNDYADTLNVKTFYDTDNKNFDGTFIQDFQVMNNADLNFDWENDTIPNGEYYIYCITDDGYNAPVAQYAPGSILVQNDTLVEIPQNIQLNQIGDSLKVSWDEPVQPYTYAAVINYQKPIDKLSGQEVIADSNHCYITGLEMGKKYEVWCQFLNLYMDKGPESETVSIVLSTDLRNNPPYFEMDPDSTWIFIEDTFTEYNLNAADADNDDLTYGIVEDTLGMTIAGNTLSWTPTSQQTGVFDIQFTVTDGTTYDTIRQYMIVYNAEQMKIDLAFSSVNLYESDNMFIKLKNFHVQADTLNIILTNLNTSFQTEVNCRKVNAFDFIGQFGLSFINRSEIPVNNGDTIQASYFYVDSLYTALAYYDSLPQPSDVTPPAQIIDLVIEGLGTNEIILRWTAVGNDQNIGKAYQYDIRYHFDTIANDNDYMVSHRYSLFYPPKPAGEPDSVIIDLATLDSTHLFNKIWWAIVAEDEMYNRSNFGTTDGHNYHLMPYNLETEIINVNTVEFDWDGPMPGNSRDTIAFNGYDLFRRKNQEGFIKISSLLDTTIFTDVVFDNQNALYTYGIQAVYSGGENSDTLYSEQIELGLYTPVNVFIDCMDSLNNNGVNYSMSSIDSLYPQNYQRITGESGLMLFSSVVKGDYVVTISKGFYASLIDTVTISGQNNQLAFELWPVIVLSKDSMLIIADTNSILNRHFNIQNNSNFTVDYTATAVEEDTTLSWIDIINPSGSVAANAEDTVWVQVNTQDLLSSEDYHADIILSFNDTVFPQRTIPVLLKTTTQQVLTIPEGWGGISGYIDPVDKDVTHIFSAVEEQLVILQTSNLVYWPSQGINTIGDWNYLSGYKIKTMSDIQVALVGPMGQSKTLFLDIGWTLIPVLSSSPVNTQLMFSPLGDTLIIIKEVAGVGLYWPSQGVNSLDSLFPGKAYYLCTAHSCQITFPENQRYNEAFIVPESIFPSTDVWNPVVPSHSSHIIGIDEQALNKLEEGDYLGVFNSEGLCCGITRIESKNKPTGFPVFSDDISTEIVDGFSEGEAMEFRLYRPSTGELYNLEPVFDMQQTHSGDFAVNGLSFILDFDVTWTITDLSPSSMRVDIYPIPANNELIIDFRNYDDGEYRLKIYNPSGILLLTEILIDANTKLDISSLKPGIYALRIEGEHSVFTKKIVVK